MTVGSQIVRVLRRNLVQALRRKQLDEAENLLGQLKEQEPLSLETRGLELEYLIAAGQGHNAHVMAEQLLRLYPQSARIQFLAGRVHYREKHYPTALQCFKESNILHGHRQTRRWLGKTQTQCGQFTEAEATLLALLPDTIEINLDLAWLYERMGQPARAMEHTETYLNIRPDNQFAINQRLRLRTQILDPQTLSEDVDTLLELDEEIPPEMLPAYIQNLLASGQGHLARQFISRHSARFDEKTAASLAWICYRLQAYDLAMSLFIHGLPTQVNDVKYLSALEAAARQCKRTDELIDRYDALADSEKRLYGRIKSLQKRFGKEA